jgi:hypothetical protein
MTRITSAVTQADIQKLQDTAFLADRDISTLRDRDPSRATQLATELSDLKDEVVYLKVKLRKDRTLNRNEFADVRNRIDDLRTRAQAAPQYANNSNTNTNRGSSNTGFGDSSRTSQTGTRSSSRGAVEMAMVEDRFEGTTMTDLIIDGRTAVPAGSVVRGVVTSVQSAGRIERKASMNLSFDRITVNGRDYPLRATVTEALEGEGIRADAGKAGAGAAVGAIIGGILGGVKGALAGVLIGGGGVVAATEGKEIDLPQGAVLRLRVDSPVEINSR